MIRNTEEWERFERGLKLPGLSIEQKFKAFNDLMAYAKSIGRWPEPIFDEERIAHKIRLASVLNGRRPTA